MKTKYSKFIKYFFRKFQIFMYTIRTKVYITLQESNISIYLMFLAYVKSNFLMLSILGTGSFFLV